MRQFIDIVKQALMEGRDAPLYHGTHYIPAIRILEQNAIQADTVQRIMDYLHDERGVSLSRLRNSALKFGEVLFVLDQTKLSHNFKIYPVDFFAYSAEPENRGQGRRQGDYNEAEEFVAGSIEPLSKYLLEIQISIGAYRAILRSRYDEHHRDHQQHWNYDILLKHPLLKVTGSTPEMIKLWTEKLAI